MTDHPDRIIPAPAETCKAMLEEVESRTCAHAMKGRAEGMEEPLVQTNDLRQWQHDLNVDGPTRRLCGRAADEIARLNRLLYLGATPLPTRDGAEGAGLQPGWLARQLEAAGERVADMPERMTAIVEDIAVGVFCAMKQGEKLPRLEVQRIIRSLSTPVLPADGAGEHPNAEAGRAGLRAATEIARRGGWHSPAGAAEPGKEFAIADQWADYSEACDKVRREMRALILERNDPKLSSLYYRAITLSEHEAARRTLLSFPVQPGAGEREAAIQQARDWKYEKPKDRSEQAWNDGMDERIAELSRQVPHSSSETES